jgi:hypothetical protein
MPSEDTFFSKTRRLIEQYDRAKKLRTEGRLSDERYMKLKGDVTCRLPQIKEEDIAIINEKLSFLEAKLEELKQRNLSGKMEEREYQSLRHGFEAFRANLESDKSVVELCSGEELLECLRRQCEAKQYEAYWVRQDGKPLLAHDGELDDFSLSYWSKASAILLVLAALSFGVMGGNELAVVLCPASVVISLAVGTLLIHEVSLIMKFKNASVSRAFGCVVQQLVIAVFLGAVLLGLMVYTMSHATSPVAILKELGSFGLLGMALMTVLVVSSVFIVKSNYEVSLASALVPALMGYVVCLSAAASIYLVLLT